MIPDQQEELKKFQDGVTAALLRAARRARDIARRTGTAIVVVRDGKLVRAYPRSDDPGDDIIEVIGETFDSSM